LQCFGSENATVGRVVRKQIAENFGGTVADIRPFDISPMSAFGPQKKPKVQIKRQKTSLGRAYRIYIDGKYVGAGLTQASARDGAKRMLAVYERTVSRRIG
jgi:hypothetical protein